MANLGSGVLVKLLGEMGVEKKMSDQDCKPVLLQIRSIIPVLAEDDLWPNQGFYLKVSDSSHAMYVSLPQEKDDMVLCNKLRLGQLITVEKLEAAYPVPMLKGVKPVPGWHASVGNPKNLVPIDNLVNVPPASDAEFWIEKNKKQERLRSLSSSKVRPNEETTGRASRSRNCGREKEPSDVMEVHRTISSALVDKDSDSESSISSSSSATTVKRRSWNGRDFSDSLIIKHGRKPISSSRTARVSSVFSAVYDSSDDNSSSKSKRKDIGIDMKSVKSSNRSRIPTSAKCCEKSLDPAVVFSFINEKKFPETKILWNSLPSTLVNLGKEVLSHRDVALLAAQEALQEAAAAERLLKCLSTYSELQAGKGDHQQASVDHFLSLQDDLVFTRHIIQSLTSIDPLIADRGDPTSPGSIRESLKLALDRKKNATQWIKAALASDLTLFSGPNIPKGTKNGVKGSAITQGSNPRGVCLESRHVNTSEIHDGLAAEKDGPPHWSKGRALHPALDLTNSLHNELRRWFLAFVENYLDEVKSKTFSMESDSQVAEMMCQIKRVSEWLDVMVNEKIKTLEVGSENSSPAEDSDLEAYGRLRNKIYVVLLKHVERTATTLKI